MAKRKILISLLLIFSIFAACLASCSKKLPLEQETEQVTSKNQEEKQTETASVETETETEQEIEESPKRVIALSKSNAELWILAGGTLIATSEDALGIPGLNPDVVSLGDMDHVSLEAVAALSPELLILFSTDPAQKALGEAALGLGIPVYFTNIDGFSDYEAVMKDFTAYTQREDLLKKYVTNIHDEILTIIGKVPEKDQEKTYLLLHISATKSKVEKNDYFACEIFNELGLVNIAADTSALNELSIEAIAAADPDYIFLVPRGNEEKAKAAFTEQFSSLPVWNSLSAVKNGQYYLLDKDLFGLKPNAAWAEAYSRAYTLLYGNT